MSGLVEASVIDICQSALSKATSNPTTQANKPRQDASYLHDMYKEHV